jgi:hypothetical protein
MSGLVAAVALAGLAQAAAAQETAGARDGEVETAPIQCWWKTDTTHVRIAERFTLTLTCGVIETSRITVVASTNGLDPGALQLTPFEVVSGTRRADILAPPWRYFQYDYGVRLLSEGFFGQDVSIPALRVTYNIQAAAGAGQGRDQTYVLPALPMRIASLVPQDAADIRDAVTIGFEAIEARQFRGTGATVAGGILLGGAGVLLLAGGLRAVAGVRKRRPAAARTVSPAAVLNGCVHALEIIRTDAAREGWSPALARRALAVARLAGAAATGRTLAQAAVPSDAVEREGQLSLRPGIVRRRRVMVSASTTAAAIERDLSRGRVRPSSRAALDAVRDAIQVFTSAGYGRAADLVAGHTLDDALAQSLSAIRQLRRRAIVPTAGWLPLRTPEASLSSASMTGERL